MQAHQRVLVSEAEFLALPESTQKVELLDGEVVVSASPSVWHQEVLRRTVQSLGNWADETDQPVMIGQSPLDVRFRPNVILQPDAFVMLGLAARDLKVPIDRIPDICIEIVSTDRVYDRVTKRLIYAQAGVREYWVAEQAGLVERFSGAELSMVEEIRDRLESPLLEGFSLDLSKVFRGPD